MTILKYLIALSFSLLIIVKSVHAHAHSAHVHGQAELSIVMENNSVLLSFNAPAESLVGFEHRAQSKAEREKLKQLKQKLHRPDNLFAIQGGKCQLAEKHIDLESIMPSDHSHNHNGHAELSINYQLQCEDTSKLVSISLSAFQSFKHLEKVTAFWATEHEQGSHSLTKEYSTLTFKGINESR